MIKPMGKRPTTVVACFFVLPVFAGNEPTEAQKTKALSGGAATVFNTTHNAFSLPSANMPLSRKLDFSVGNSFFRNPWVIAPATTTARDGLGPVFNTNGCQNCHIKDGRGHPPESPSDNAVSLLVRLSVPAKTSEEKQQRVYSGIIPEPTYGGQLQDFGVPGVPEEGKVNIKYTPITVKFADGETVTLRKPNLTITGLNYGPMQKDALFSVRVAPPMIGLGLLEAIAETDILVNADPDDRNNDGISGKANQVWDKTKQQTTLGRFGWKAGQPSLMQQNAAAFNGDIGITSNLFPATDCTPKQAACQKAATGGNPEVEDKILKFVEFYTQNLAVPARRNLDDPQVQQGEKLFQQAQCDNCHITQFKTPTLKEQPEQSNQVIHPYTDLLVHDMGEGLADNRPEFLANGKEWRTAPLWGIGLIQQVNGHTYLLHDGRARNLMEAILWHGGEAEAAKQRVLNMAKQDRQALLAFLNSL
ncbi:di-heme oxidoredictase family protein [Spartinivicinus marinus]|nr:di-heme oxidoredictase family protein [Spartinivicinus marinus]MCX4028375.1 thiol oxidoreductase [Spartinivicinus marinus]